MVRIPACHAGGREFESRPPRHEFHGRLAQLVERYPYKVDATGSSPVVPTMNLLPIYILIQSASIMFVRYIISFHFHDPFV